MAVPAAITQTGVCGMPTRQAAIASTGIASTGTASIGIASIGIASTTVAISGRLPPGTRLPSLTARVTECASRARVHYCAGHSSNTTPASKPTCTATNTPARSASEELIIARPSYDPLTQHGGATSVPRSDSATTGREWPGLHHVGPGLGAESTDQSSAAGDTGAGAPILKSAFPDRG